ncbi:MAG: acyl-CoA/acyl-ACP dehydrogenase [Proteobacteria bacterium]|nr:acyl-CoA/acyl-ACP dehydrogenase [Pseudomonadota bacterium]
MHFGLTEEQELLQQTIREFAASELPAPKLRALFDEGSGHDPGLWAKSAEIGLAGLTVPESYGGAGLELLDLALAFEVLGESALPGPYLGHALAALAIAEGGSEDQKQRWLPRLASGEAIGTVALAERNNVWECADWRVEFRDGALAGEKEFVPYAQLADLTLVGTVGGGLAVLERDAEGSRVDAVDGVDRTRALGRLELTGARAEALPAPPGTAERVLDAGRVLLAADSFGGAWKLIETTAEYTRTREQFGTPIAQFQSVKHMLADAATEIEPARGLFWYAAYAWERLPEESPRAAATAKAHLTDRAADVSRTCVELHGGIGFTWECDVQFWVKRAMFNRTFLGAPSAQLERVADLGGW